MMPTIFAHAWPTDFAKAHFNFVGDDCGKNQILSTQAFTFTECERRSDEIARMTRVGFPIDVVVIHGADHVAVQKCGINRVGLEAGDERGGAAVAAALATGRVRRGGHRTVMLQQNLRVILLTASKSATDGVEPK